MFALLAGWQFAAAAEPEPVRLPAEIGDVTLTDGRTLRSVVVLSQTSTAINVRHGGGLTKIEKRQLPPETLARFPISEELAAREKQQAQAAEAQRAAQQKLVNQRKAEQAAAAKVAAGPAGGGATTSPAQNPASKPATPAEQLAHAPKGLYITNWGANTAGEVVVEVVNPTTSAQKMDARDLVALQLDTGQVVQGDDLRFSAREVANNWVEAGQRKLFTVHVPGGLKLAAIAWAGSGEWRVMAGWAEATMVTSETEAIKLAQLAAKVEKERQRVQRNQSGALSATKEQEKSLVTK